MSNDLLSPERLTYLVGLSQVTKDTLPPAFHEAVAGAVAAHNEIDALRQQLTCKCSVLETPQIPVDFLEQIIFLSDETYAEAAARLNAWLRENTLLVAPAAEAAPTSMSTGQPVSETSSWGARFLSLSKEERQFVIRVGLNGSGKYAASPCSGSDGRGLWFRPEDLGLIVCEGSYKWSAPGFAEGIESLAAVSDVRTPGSLP